MKTKLHNILFGFLLLCLMIHLAFSPLHWIKDKELDGYFEKPTDSVFVWKDYFTKKYQDSTEKYLNYSFGMFPAFIRINHQLEYSLFGNIHVKDVHRGKNGYLMRYYDNFFAERTFEKTRLEKYMRNYLILHDSLAVAGKNIVWVVAPDKNLVYSEYLPDSVQQRYHTNKFYEDFKQAFKENGLQLIDLNEQAIKDKDKYPFAVINKGGVHWTSSYAARMFDSVCSYLQRVDSVSIKNTFTDKKMNNPWAPDIDVEYAANLLVPLERDNIYFTTIASVSSAKDKKLLMIGDSFCHVWMWNKWYKECFHPASEFWYYNREANSLDNTFKRNVEHQRARELTKDFDTFIIVFSAANLEQLDYGFVEDMFR